MEDKIEMYLYIQLSGIKEGHIINILSYIIVDIEERNRTRGEIHVPDRKKIL